MRGGGFGFGVGGAGAELGVEQVEDLAADGSDLALVVGARCGAGRAVLASLRTALADGGGEGIEGTPELTLDGGLVAVELFEDLEIGQAVTGVQARVIGAGAAQQNGLGAGDVAGFGAGDAAKAPGIDGDVLDAGLLEGVLGVVIINKGLNESGEVLGVLVEDWGVSQGSDKCFGANAVLEGVEGDAGFALGGLRAGRFLGVTTVGFDLSSGCHLG
ncbi:MAG: hypothetical protein HYY30_07630 [Chloroflexi bacterium]|nr:hypothetical protein [Chloroflexota bacterium]